MDTVPVTAAKRRLLERLKRTGPASARELAEALGLTDVAVRQHLLALQDSGLVEQSMRPAAGRGRPGVLWSLSALAAGVFPDRHADLTLELIRATREALGEDGLLRVIDVRAAKQAEAYGAKIPGGKATLRRRVEALARERTAEGYMAEVVREPDGAYLLMEHHCPICDAARSCVGLCHAELSVFRKALGSGVAVERVQHLLSDGERCVYRIRQGRAPLRA